MNASRTTQARNRAYFAATITHFFGDILNSSRNLLVGLLAVSLGLTNQQVGITLLSYNVGSALMQPLFGWLTDRFGPRWPLVGGLGWMIVFYSLTAASDGWPALIFVTVAGVGSGAFHPSGTLVASKSSSSNRTRATAIFFGAGQFGLFLGPVLAGILLKEFGWLSYLSLPLISLGALLADWLWVHPGAVGDGMEHAHAAVTIGVLEEDTPRLTSPHGGEEPVSPPPGGIKGGQSPNQPSATANTDTPRLTSPHGGEEPISPLPGGTKGGSSPARSQPRLVYALVIVVIVTNTVSIGILTFVPKLFTELGYAEDYVGWATGLYMLGSAIGGIVGGNLADRYGGKWVIVAGFALAVAPVWSYIPAGDPYRFILLMLAGFFGGMPHSILVLLAQSLLPKREGFASGLVLGLMFFSGAIGSYILGLVADEIGLAITMQGTAWLMALGAAAAVIMPRQPRMRA